MDSTPENSGQIRCGMCGTLSSADAATCEHCGARLRPMTPEELGLISSGEDPQAARLQPHPGAEEDPLDALRQSMESNDDETIIGPSARRQVLPSDEPVEDVEPDFTFGGRSWLDDQNLEPTEDARSIIPDWLGSAEPQDSERVSSEESTSESAMPDWLQEAYGSLPEEEPAPSAGTPLDDELDALRPPDDLPVVGLDQEDQEPAAPLVDLGLPDWLQAMDESAESPSSPAEIVEDQPTPDGSEEPQEAESNEMPAWLNGLGLGGESHAADPASEIEEPASEPELTSEEGVPDWLAEATSSEATIEEESEGEPETPEEVSEPGVEEAETAEESIASREPVSSGEAAHEPPSTEPSAEGEMPAWLASLGAKESTPPEEPSDSEDITEEPPAIQPGAVVEVPEWLAELGGKEIPAAEEAEQETPAIQPGAVVEVPEWLMELGGKEIPAAEEAEQETPSAEPDAEVEVPEWLGGLSREEIAASEEAAQETPSTEPSAEVEVPEWLGELSGEDTVSSEEAEQETPSAEPDAEVEVPEWLGGLSGEEIAAAEEAEQETPSAEPDAEVEVPEWLGGLSSEETVSSEEAEQETPSTEPSAEVEVPEWLGGLSGEVLSPESKSQSLEALAAGGIDDETPDWLNVFDDNFALPSEAPLASDEGEDLLGLSGDLARPVVPQEDEEIDLAAEGLPTWLQDSTREGSAETFPAEELPEGMLSEMASLRFEAITGRESNASATETLGALKDVSGVVKPELLFTGASLQVGQIVDHVLVSPEQQKRIQTLQALFGQESKGVVIAGRSSAFPLVRWITALILIAAIAAAALAGTSILSAPAVGEGPQSVHQLIDGVAANRAVVMVFEYEGDTSAELQPLATALMEHLARQNATVYIVSSRPTGPAMAEMALSEVHEQTGTPGWVNLGYLAGGTKGISALTSGTLPGVVSPLSYDYQNAPTGLASTRLDDLDPALVIVVAAQAEDLRVWVEQISPTAGYPIVAAMSVSSTPMTTPYVQSGQVAALVSGVNDAVAYRALENQAPSPLLAAKWNAQAMGGAAAAIMILAGGVFNILRTIQQSQE